MASGGWAAHLQQGRRSGHSAHAPPPQPLWLGWRRAQLPPQAWPTPAWPCLEVHRGKMAQRYSLSIAPAQNSHACNQQVFAIKACIEGVMA